MSNEGMPRVPRHAVTFCCRYCAAKVEVDRDPSEYRGPRGWFVVWPLIRDAAGEGYFASPGEVFLLCEDCGRDRQES